jgi:hypothetical protein
MQEDKDKLLAELAELKIEVDSLLKNRQLWTMTSVVLSIWLIPYGWTAFVVGCGMFLAGTRWLKNHALAMIGEHEMFVIASGIEGIEDE